MIEWLKETLIGLGCLFVLWLLAIAYSIFSRISEEKSSRGKLARKIGKFGWGTFLTYMIVCSFVIPIIFLIIWLFS